MVDLADFAAALDAFAALPRGVQIAVAVNALILAVIVGLGVIAASEIAADIRARRAK